jgi:Mn-dependent DtxR family transcriptional regulator
MSSAHEDYLEAIVQLGGDNQDVRSIDIAAKLDVSKPSVNRAIKNLKAAGMVEQQHYGNVSLTKKGLNYAQSVLDRHHVIYHFLIDVLGVDPEVAAEEACGMEHSVSLDTLNRWRNFLVQFTISNS